MIQHKAIVMKRMYRKLYDIGYSYLSFHEPYYGIRSFTSLIEPKEIWNGVLVSHPLLVGDKLKLGILDENVEVLERTFREDGTCEYLVDYKYDYIVNDEVTETSKNRAEKVVENLKKENLKRTEEAKKVEKKEWFWEKHFR